MSTPGRASVLQVNGCRLYVKRSGSGPPLYALHGGPGLDHTTLSEGMAEIELHFQVHYIDLRGHGQSERTGDKSYTFEQLAEDVEMLRMTFRHERIVLLGHSMGAKIALLYALRYSQHLDGLVLVGANAGPPRFAQNFLSAPGRLLARVALLAWCLWGFLRQICGRPWKLEQAHKAFWGYCWPLYAPRHPSSDRLQRILLRALKPPLSALPALMSQLAKVDLSRELYQVQVRTLVICGEEDVLFWAEQQAFERLPNVNFAAIPHAGHFPQLDQPELFNYEVLNFIQHLPRAA